MSEEEETNLQRVTFIQSQDGRLSVVAEQIGVFDRTNDDRLYICGVWIRHGLIEDNLKPSETVKYSVNGRVHDEIGPTETVVQSEQTVLALGI